MGGGAFHFSSSLWSLHLPVFTSPCTDLLSAASSLEVITVPGVPHEGGGKSSLCLAVTALQDLPAWPAQSARD